MHRSTSSWIKSERPFSDHDKASPPRQIPPAEMIRIGARSVAVGRGRLAAGVEIVDYGARHGEDSPEKSRPEVIGSTRILGRHSLAYASRLT